MPISFSMNWLERGGLGNAGFLILSGGEPPICDCEEFCTLDFPETSATKAVSFPDTAAFGFHKFDIPGNCSLGEECITEDTEFDVGRIDNPDWGKLDPEASCVMDARQSIELSTSPKLVSGQAVLTADPDLYTDMGASAATDRLKLFNSSATSF
jgi:hypothetical protein